METASRANTAQGRTDSKSSPLSLLVHMVTCPRLAGEYTVVSLVALLRGTVVPSCVGLVAIKRCVRHQSSWKYLETTKAIQVVCG